MAVYGSDECALFVGAFRFAGLGCATGETAGVVRSSATVPHSEWRGRVGARRPQCGLAEAVGWI